MFHAHFSTAKWFPSFHQYPHAGADSNSNFCLHIGHNPLELSVCIQSLTQCRWNECPHFPFTIHSRHLSQPPILFLPLYIYLSSLSIYIYLFLSPPLHFLFLCIFSAQLPLAEGGGEPYTGDNHRREICSLGRFRRTGRDRFRTRRRTCRFPIATSPRPCTF